MDNQPSPGPPLPLSLARAPAAGAAARRAATGVALAVMVVSSAVLVGWWAGLPQVTTVLPGLASMKANTALCFLLSGLGLALVANGRALRLALAGHGLVLGIAGASLVASVAGAPLVLDELLAADPATVGALPGRMSEATAALFCLLAIDGGVQSLGWRSRGSDVLVLVLLSTSLFALGGYLSSASTLYAIEAFSSMALHTTVCFLALTLGTLAGAPARPISDLVRAPGDTGVLLRALLPGILLAPTAGLLVARLGVSSGLLPPGAMAPVLMAVGAALLGALVIGVGHALARHERERDLAQARVAEALVRQGRSEALLQAVFESSHDGILTVDGDGRVVSANAAARRLLGPEAVDGARLGALLPVLSAAPGPQSLTVGGGPARPARELEVRQQELAGVAPAVRSVLLRDVTAERAARRTLRSLNEELDARVRARTADLQKALGEREILLQEVHHRVKNNLQMVSSLLQLQLHRVSDPEARVPMEDSVHRISALAQLHHRLHDTDEIGLVPLDRYLTDLAHSLASGLGGGRAHLELALSPVAVDADTAIPTGLIFNELFTNALKHGTGPDGQLGVRAALEVDDERISLTVADEGPGLPAGFSPTAGGSLGMLLVTNLVQQLDGELSTGEGPGARFHITIPRPPVEAPAGLLETP